MKRALRQGTATALLLIVAGCAVTGVGVSGDAGVGYSSGYYEPYGYDYGGWGNDYYVAPWHGRDHRRRVPHVRPGCAAAEAAPACLPAAGARPVHAEPPRRVRSH